MADLNKILEALANAERAGNTEDAAALAQMVRDVQAAPDIAGVGMDEGPIANLVGNDQKEAARFQKLYGGLPNADPVTRGEAGLRGFQAGTSAGLGPRVSSTINTLIDPLRGKGEGLSYSQRRPQRQGYDQGRLEQSRKEYPGTSFLSEVAGAIPVSILATKGMQGLPYVGGVARTALAGKDAASPMARALAASTVGGVEGAVYGFNSEPGDIRDRLLAAAKSGGVSAALGGFSPSIGDGARGLYNTFAGPRAAARKAGFSRPAFEILAETAEADNYRGAGAQSLAASGDDAMLADAGNTMRSLTDFLGQRPGPSQGIVNRAVTDRTEEAAGRVTGALDDTLGAPQGPRSVARNTAESTSGARSEAYDAAYDVPIDYAAQTGKNIEDALDRIPNATKKQAIDEANDAMVSEGRRNKQILFDVAEDGTVTMREMPNVEQLDQIKRALQRIGREEVDNFGRPTSAGGRAKRLAGNLRAAIGEAVPEYNDATKLGADKIEMDNALILGGDLLKKSTTREIVQEAAGNMSAAERDMVAKGVRAHIDELMAEVKLAFTDPNMNSREAAAAIKKLSSRANREKLEIVLGAKETRAMFDELDKSLAAFQLRAGVADNSKTAVRDMFNTRFEGANNSGFIRNAGRLNVTGTIGEAAGALTGQSSAQVRRVNDKVAAELAETLVGTRGLDARQLLAKLDAAQKQMTGPNQEFVRNLMQNIMMTSPAVVAPAVQGGGLENTMNNALGAK